MHDLKFWIYKEHYSALFKANKDKLPWTTVLERVNGPILILVDDGKNTIKEFI